jgi:branched-subunit amino acid transport protein AzlD
MIIKVLIAICLLVIIVSLFRGLVFLVKEDQKSKKLVNALTVRVSAAVILILLIIIGIKTGELQPHGIYPTP